MNSPFNITNLASKLRALIGWDYDLHALQHLSSFNIGYIPWTSSAMRPSGLRLAVNEVIINRRQTGIEFGAGISTLYLAAAFERVGGNLTVVEHDHVWLEKMRLELARINVDARTCNLVHAPLDYFDSSGTEKRMWYNRDILSKVLGNLKFDFCLVDGPIATPERKAVRGPAGEFLIGRLSDSYAFFIDDIDRPNDLALAREWTKMHDGKLSVYASMGAVAVIRPKADISYNIC